MIRQTEIIFAGNVRKRISIILPSERESSGRVAAMRIEAMVRMQEHRRTQR